MKEKGFTLIELIATVLILAIVFLYVTPKVIEVMNRADNNSIAIIEEKVIAAAKEYVIDYDKTFINRFQNLNDTDYININNLITAGLVDIDDANELGNNASVKVVLNENDVLEYSMYYSQ